MERENGLLRPGEGKAQSLTPWKKYAQVLLLSNELVFVD